MKTVAVSLALLSLQRKFETDETCHINMRRMMIRLKTQVNFENVLLLVLAVMFLVLLVDYLNTSDPSLSAQGMTAKTFQNEMDRRKG